MSLIYVRESDVPKTKTRKDLLRRFLRGVSYTSYSDPECTIIQCDKGKFRSLTELHQITLSRFPKTSFEAIVKIIADLIDEDVNISMIWCTQVNKIVLRYYSGPTKKYYTDYTRDKYYNTKGVDGYSLKDYETIIQKLKKEENVAN